MKLVIFTLLIASCMGSWTKFESLIGGLEKGLKKANESDDACWDVVTGLDANREKIEADITSIIGGDISKIPQFISDCGSICDALPSFNSKCDVAGLRDQMLQLIDPKTGFALLKQRYNANKDAINGELTKIENCYEDSKDCDWAVLGEAWGTIIRLITEWRL